MSREAVLRRLRPEPAEEEALRQDVADLLEAAGRSLTRLGLPGVPSVQGSVAKGTWLQGEADIDLFLLLDLGVPEGRLESAAEAVARDVLQGTRRRYAQHPYVVGTFRDRTVDLVPAYRVAHAGHRMSAVDRTPFHTAWVRERLTPQQRDEVRLLKKWLKGVEVYGAQTALGGFSGYLVEVLVARFGRFDDAVAWLARGAQPRRIALGQDAVQDDVAPLVVVDPVDPARNCAAAVRPDTLDRAAEAARAFHGADAAGAAERFFFPAPPRAEPAKRLHAALRGQGAAWLGVVLEPRTPRLDIVLPQFQRAARIAADALERAGFPVRRTDVAAFPAEGTEAVVTGGAAGAAAADGEPTEHVGVQWVTDGAVLPERRVHDGPHAGSRHAERFREKWEGHPLAEGPLYTGEDGRLRVEVRVEARTPLAWLTANAHVLTGRHVQEAGLRFVADPADAAAAWAPRVADVVLDRRPWER